MGRIGIIAIFLAGIGAAYLFRSYFNDNLKEIAILMSLGVTRKTAYFIFLLQVTLLGAVSALLAVLFSIFLLPVFTMIFKRLI